MRNIVDLERYPLEQVGSDQWLSFVATCQQQLESEGLFNLPGLIKPAAVTQAVAELQPVLETASYTHEREHNIYFKAMVEGLDANHPALSKFRTSNQTICADQMAESMVLKLYEWLPFAKFLAAVMGKPQLFTMDDPLARVNVMSYRAGQTLNWHFDRSEFTTTLLLQAPENGGQFEYAKDLRSDDDPNYAAVAQLIAGERPTQKLALEPGTLNIFRGKNTAHRVTEIAGDKARIIAVFSYFEQPGVVFTKEEQTGFYGRVS